MKTAAAMEGMKNRLGQKILETERMKQKIGMLMVAAALCAFGFGCKNTAHGVGKDVENVGEKIQEKTD